MNGHLSQHRLSTRKRQGSTSEEVDPSDLRVCPVSDVVLIDTLTR